MGLVSESDRTESTFGSVDSEQSGALNTRFDATLPWSIRLDTENFVSEALNVSQSGSGQLDLNSETGTQNKLLRTVVPEFRYGLREHYTLARIQRTPEPLSRVTVTERWEGEVVEIEDEVFRARFVREDENSDWMQAEFSLKNVSRDDRELVTIGALFEIVAGETLIGEGISYPYSSIRFLRLPRTEDASVSEALEQAREKYSWLIDLSPE